MTTNEIFHQDDDPLQVAGQRMPLAKTNVVPGFYAKAKVQALLPLRARPVQIRHSQCPSSCTEASRIISRSSLLKTGTDEPATSTWHVEVTFAPVSRAPQPHLFDRAASDFLPDTSLYFCGCTKARYSIH